jgi:endonuclease/exonuclease/phosphatase family metal-dependent hydrolase
VASAHPLLAAVGVLVRLWLGLLVVVVVLRLTGTERGPAMALLVGALPLTLLPAWPMAAGFALRRAWRSAAVALAVVVAHLALVAPSLGAAPRPTSGTPLRVVVANLYVLSERQEEAGEALRALRPDVLVLPELDTDGLEGLRAAGLLDDLPHAAVQLEGRRETVGLLSRLPLLDPDARVAAARSLPRATVDVGGTRVRLLAAHPLPPVEGLERLWRQAYADLREEVRAEELPLVLAGDMNADRDHAPFRRLLDEGLRDAHDERGRGLVRTFPVGFPVLQLDHVLVRDGAGGAVGVVDVREVDIPGSDHLGVVADLLVRSR